MKFIFENSNISDNIKKIVASLIENNRETNGNISVEYIPWDEVEDYDIPKDMTGAADEIYLVSQCVCGAWDQPLGAVAVAH